MGAAEALGGVREYVFRDAVRIVDDGRIPIADDFPTQACQVTSALLVLLGSRQMLAPVEFDRELRLPTGNIHDVWTDHELPRESWAVAGKSVPDRALNVGRTIP
ncbi:hypothetical protein SAMN05444678_106195 [Sphingomonas sp. YR710]|nr:hypothetical protein SAMN05444678_106195 [Sphingomonas sp. YR710]